MAKRIFMIVCLIGFIVIVSSCVRSIPHPASSGGPTFVPHTPALAIPDTNLSPTPGQATLTAELQTVVPQLSGTLAAPGYPPATMISPNPAKPPITGGLPITTTLQASASSYLYGVQSGAPVQTTNFLHPSATCDYSGVAGQVINAKGEPVAGLVVEIYGTLENHTVMTLTLTGSATALGPAGFEVPLANHLVASQGTVKARLYNLDGIPQSDIFPFDTFADCERNLVILNFAELVNHKVFFPVVEWKSRPVAAPWFDYFPLIEKFFRRRIR